MLLALCTDYVKACPGHVSVYSDLEPDSFNLRVCIEIQPVYIQLYVLISPFGCVCRSLTGTITIYMMWETHTAILEPNLV